MRLAKAWVAPEVGLARTLNAQACVWLGFRRDKRQSTEHEGDQWDPSSYAGPTAWLLGGYMGFFQFGALFQCSMLNIFPRHAYTHMKM